MLAKFHGTHCKLQFYIVLLRFLAHCLFIMASKFALPARLFHPARLIILEKLPSCYQVSKLHLLVVSNFTNYLLN